MGTWNEMILGSTLQALREDGFDLGEIGFDLSAMETPDADFEPGTEDDQGKLDQKKKITCPECAHVFTP